MSERRTKPLRDVKPPMPDVLKSSVARAQKRTQRRHHVPPMSLERKPDGKPEWSWPWREEDTAERQAWQWMLIDAFGTRHESIAGAFIDQLVQLCSQSFDDEHGEWVPNEGDLHAMLGIISSQNPKNEAEAALCAQMAATHMLMMKIGARIASQSWPDTRMVNAFAKLANASSGQAVAMAAIRGKGHARQTIKVVSEKHIHNHQHVHFEGGDTENATRPHQTEPARSDAPGGVTALPSSDEIGKVLPLSRSEGQASVPKPRRRAG